MRNFTKRSGIVLAASALLTTAAGFAASPAWAATTGKATASNYYVTFTAGSGKANNVVVTRSGRIVTIDDKYKIKAGKGCKAVKGDSTKVRCTTTTTLISLSFHLGDRNDRFTNRTDLRMIVNGGTGNDVLIGGDGTDWLSGEAGNDRLYGGAGNDSLRGGKGTDRLYGQVGNDSLNGEQGNDLVVGGAGDDLLEGDGIGRTPGRDVIRGGSGVDSVSYAYHPAGVKVTLDGKQNDGAPGEKDLVAADVEDIFGSSFADLLIGNDGPNTVHGYEAAGGGDVIYGRGGDDTLRSDFGGSRLYGEGGDDFLMALHLDPGPADNMRPDIVDGGANGTANGDRCQVKPVDVVTNCERLS